MTSILIFNYYKTCICNNVLWWILVWNLCLCTTTKWNMWINWCCICLLACKAFKHVFVHSPVSKPMFIHERTTQSVLLTFILRNYIRLVESLLFYLYVYMHIPLWYQIYHYGCLCIQFKFMQALRLYMQQGSNYMVKTFEVYVTIVECRFMWFGFKVSAPTLGNA